jgi:hypothetical protein
MLDVEKAIVSKVSLSGGGVVMLIVQAPYLRQLGAPTRALALTGATKRLQLRQLQQPHARRLTIDRTTPIPQRHDTAGSIPDTRTGGADTRHIYQSLEDYHNNANMAGIKTIIGLSFVRMPGAYQAVSILGTTEH